MSTLSLSFIEDLSGVESPDALKVTLIALKHLLDLDEKAAQELVAKLKSESADVIKQTYETEIESLKSELSAVKKRNSVLEEMLGTRRAKQLEAIDNPDAETISSVRMAKPVPEDSKFASFKSALRAYYIKETGNTSCTYSILAAWLKESGDFTQTEKTLYVCLTQRNPLAYKKGLVLDLYAWGELHGIEF